MGSILTRGAIDPTFTAPMGTNYINTATKVVWRNLDGATQWGAVECFNNFAATTNPTVDDDVTTGYAPGSIWLNLTLDMWFVCVDSTDGVAIWIQQSDNIRTITTTPVTLLQGDNTVVVDATGGNRVINLPPAADVPTKVYRVKKKDSLGNTVTIEPDAAETIDGVAAKVLTDDNEGVIIQSDGTEWHILSQVGTLKLEWLETPSGTIDGVNDTFTLAKTPVGNIMLFHNGLLLEPGSGNDYQLSGSTITFEAGSIPQTGDKLLVTYRY